MLSKSLGQRWLAAGAPWREGMRDAVSGRRVVEVDADGQAWAPDPRNYGQTETFYDVADPHPDFTDAATRGAALGWVREAWGDPSLTLLPIDESIPLAWEWTEDGLKAPAMDAQLPDGRPLYHTRWASEAEGIVAAAEALAVERRGVATKDALEIRGGPNAWMRFPSLIERADKPIEAVFNDEVARQVLNQLTSERQQVRVYIGERAAAVAEALTATDQVALGVLEQQGVGWVPVATIVVAATDANATMERLARENPGRYVGRLVPIPEP